MRRVANSKARPYVQSKLTFMGSNLWGEWITDPENSDDLGRYVVFSYGYHFPMWVYDMHSCQWYGNQDKFSQSTSRHCSQTIPVARDEITWLSTGFMCKLVRLGYRELIARRIITGERIVA